MLIYVSVATICQRDAGRSEDNTDVGKAFAAQNGAQTGIYTLTIQVRINTINFTVYIQII